MEIIDWLFCKKEREVASINRLFQPKAVVEGINKKTREQTMIVILGLINAALIYKLILGQ